MDKKKDQGRGTGVAAYQMVKHSRATRFVRIGKNGCEGEGKEKA